MCSQKLQEEMNKTKKEKLDKEKLKEDIERKKKALKNNEIVRK